MAAHRHFVEFLRRWLRSDSRFPLLVVGPPATSKTSVIKRVTGEEGFDLVCLTPATQTPEQVQGLGVADMAERSAFFIPLGEMKRVLSATRPTIVFLDDVIQGAKVTLNGYMALIFDKVLNGLVVPDCVRFVLASNEAKDNCGALAGTLPATITDRCFVHHLRPEAAEHLDYMNRASYPVQIKAFLKSHEELSYRFDPNAMASPTYRGWEKVKNVLEFMGSSAEPCDFAACIGEAAGNLFFAFLSIFDRLADIENIVNNPEKVDNLPREEQWAVLGLLENLFFKKPELFPACWRVVERCGPEFLAFAVASLVVREASEARKRRAEGKKGVWEPFSGRPDMVPVVNRILGAMSAPAPTKP